MNKTGFGFLCLPRLDPVDDKSIDYELLNTMVDSFLAQGGDYFDTAYTYLGGLSEEALRKSLVRRYPRDRFRIADKLPGYQLKSYEACNLYFEGYLRRCGVDYFDVCMLYCLNDKNYEIAETLDQFRFLQEVKAVGKCPMNLSIPRYFALYNDYARYHGEDWKMQNVYDRLTQMGGKPSDCIGCRQYERNCPQQIAVTAFLPKITEVFDK